MAAGWVDCVAATRFAPRLTGGYGSLPKIERGSYGNASLCAALLGGQPSKGTGGVFLFRKVDWEAGKTVVGDASSGCPVG